MLLNTGRAHTSKLYLHFSSIQPEALNHWVLVNLYPTELEKLARKDCSGRAVRHVHRENKSFYWKIELLKNFFQYKLIIRIILYDNDNTGFVHALEGLENLDIKRIVPRRLSITNKNVYRSYFIDIVQPYAPFVGILFFIPAPRFSSSQQECHWSNCRASINPFFHDEWYPQ